MLVEAQTACCSFTDLQAALHCTWCCLHFIDRETGAVIRVLSGLFGSHAGLECLGCVAFLTVCVLELPLQLEGQPLAGKDRLICLLVVFV